MIDYGELVKALRRCDMKQGCFNANCRYSVGKYFCDMDKVHKDAAAAIEDLQAELPKRGQYVHGRELSREYIGDCLASIDYEDWRCSVCGIVFEQWSIPKYNYCPNCGAKMEVQE